MKELIGKRVLFESHLPQYEGHVQDEVVREMSPSGRHVRLGYEWHKVEKVSVLEEMPRKPSPGDEEPAAVEAEPSKADSQGAQDPAPAGEAPAAGPESPTAESQ